MTAKNRSGLLEITNARNVSLLKSKFEDFSSPDSLLIYSQSSILTLIIKQSTITCSTSYRSLDLSSYLNSDKPLFTTTTAFYIFSALNVISSSNTYKKCGVALDGGVFHLELTNLIDQQSVF